MTLKVVDIEELEQTKEYKKAKKFLDEGLMREFVRKADDELKAVIVSKEMQIQQVRKETEANENYKKAVAVLKDFRASAREVTDEAKAISGLSTLILRMRKEDGN